MKIKKGDNFYDFSLRGAGSYLDSLTDFAMFLGSVEEADKAAKELLEETKKTDATAPEAPKTKAEALPLLFFWLYIRR